MSEGGSLFGEGKPGLAPVAPVPPRRKTTPSGSKAPAVEHEKPAVPAAGTAAIAGLGEGGQALLDAGWGRESAIRRLRDMADRCEEMHPEVAAGYRADAELLERNTNARS